jgi:membrane fusion protein (multidrug efflux system)
MRWYSQLAVIGVAVGGGMYAWNNWETVEPYVPAPVKAFILGTQPGAAAGGPPGAAPAGGGAGRPPGAPMAQGAPQAGQPPGGPPSQAAQGGRPQQAGGPPGGGGGRGPGGPTVVEVLPVSTGPVVEVAEAVGTTRAFESVTVTSKIAGIVEAVLFDEGQSVKAGDDLIRLDGAERRAELEGARAAVAQEEARRAELRTRLDRAVQLRRSGSGTEALVDDLTAQVKTADSAVAAAVSRQRAAEARVSDLTIKAPFAGRVGVRTVSVGALVEPRTAITTLDDVSKVRLDFAVPEVFLGRIAAGSVVFGQTVAYGDRRFEGSVAVVDTRVDPVTRSVRMTALIDNADLALKPGMFMNVALQVTTRPDAMLVLEEALVGEGPLHLAFVVKDGVIERRVVKIGQRQEGKVEVTEGLKPGETIVVRGVQRVRQGMPVTARPFGAQAAPPRGGAPGGGAPGAGGRPAGGPEAGNRPRDGAAGRGQGQPPAAEGQAASAPAGAAPPAVAAVPPRRGDTSQTQ